MASSFANLCFTATITSAVLTAPAVLGWPGAAAIAACTPTSAIAANTTITCDGTVALPGRYNIGVNGVDVILNEGSDVWFSAQGNARAAFSFDVFRSGNTSFTAKDISFTNHGRLTATTASNNPRYGAVWMGPGDQNDPDNGDMMIANNGTISVSGPNLAYAVQMWSPNGTALIVNSENGVIESVSTGRAGNSAFNGSVAIFQSQRGWIVNDGLIDATDTSDSGFAYGIFMRGTAGFENGSGFAPNYKSAEFTEERRFRLDNSGVISASGSGGAVGIQYAQAIAFDNKGTITYASPDGDAESATIRVFDSGSGSLGDLRAPLSPYRFENWGEIINQSFGSGDADALAFRIRGLTTNGVLNDAAGRGFNNALMFENSGSGRIVGNMAFGDGEDTLSFFNDSRLDAHHVSFFGGSDILVIADGTELARATIFDGGDVAGPPTDSTDRLSFDGWTDVIDGSQIVNFEEVLLTGGADVTFTDAIAVGTGLANADATGGLLFQVDDGSTARFADDFTVFGNANNYGSLDLSAPDAATGTILTIAGDYAGSGSNLIIDVALNDGGSTNLQPHDQSFTDQLIITGDASGVTCIVVNPLIIGNGAAATDRNGNGRIDGDEGILIVQVLGVASLDQGDADQTPENFVLASGPVVAGAFSYDLYHINETESESGSNDYVLASMGSRYQPAVPVYEALPVTMGALNGLPTMRERVGHRYWRQTADARPDSNGLNQAIEETAIWARIDGAHSHVDADSTTASEYSIDAWQLQTGFDGAVFDSDGGMLLAGLSFNQGIADADIRSDVLNSGTVNWGAGNIRTTNYGIGANLTWIGRNGLYADAQGQYSWFQSDLSSTSGPAIARGIDGSGYALSLEVGQQVPGSQDLIITPQVQLIYSAVDFDGFTGPSGERVTMGDGDSLRGRFGVAFEREQDWQAEDGTTSRRAIYAVANAHYEFLDGTSAFVSGAEVRSKPDAWTGELGLGGSHGWRDDRFVLHGEASYVSSLRGSHTVKGNLGFAARW